MAHVLPGISVVVATRNRLPFLKRCVESIQAQNYPKEHMELIIVDDGSTDDTPDYLAALAAREPWIRVAFQTRGWQASARNKGIALSREEYIAITDDDCTVAEDWLLSIVSAMQDQDVDGIGGHTSAPGDSLVARYMNYTRVDPILLPDGTPQYLVTTNACFRRRALDQVGLFDETFAVTGGEDTELALRMRQRGMKLKFVPACRVAHWYEPDIKTFLRRFYRYGLGTRRVFDKHLVWEYWFPQADVSLQRFIDALFNGNIQLRTFNEVEDSNLRPWYRLLHALQHLTYMAGYLYLTDLAQLYHLRGSDNNGRYQGGSDEQSTKSIVARKQRAEVILRAISFERAVPEPERGLRRSEMPDWLDEHYFPPQEPAKLGAWVGTLLTMAGIDILLEWAASHDLGHATASIPDDVLSASTRTAYDTLHKQLRDAHEAQHRSLLQQLVQQPGDNTLAKVEALCYANSVDVNRFLSWYGWISGRGDTVTG